MSWQGRVVSTEIRKILAYRSDFWVNFLGQSLMQLFIARALWEAVFAMNGQASMGGMTLPEITLYYLLAPLTLKILMGESIGFFSREIYDGGLNRYLVWPLSPLGYKALTYLTYSGFYILQMVLLYSLGRYLLVDTPYSGEELVRLLLGVGYLLVSAFTYFCLMCLCEMTAFWADNTWTLGVMLRFVGGFFGGTFIPLSFFPDTLRVVANWLPFGPMFTGPINLILGRATPMETLIAFATMILWLPLILWGMRVVWKKGNLHYTGVGM